MWEVKLHVYQWHLSEEIVRHLPAGTHRRYTLTLPGGTVGVNWEES
jgi:hypothetical protein